MKTITKPGPKKGRGGVQLPPDDSAGRCADPRCGIILYDNPAIIPDGWIIIWHTNVAGYCPECALAHGVCGAEAQAVLAKYSPMASDGTKKTSVVAATAA